MGGPEIERLIGLLARLPGMGPRSARRAALKMLQQPEARMLPLATALAEAARAVSRAGLCGNLDSRDPCAICTDPHRDRTLICVVEGVGDLWALERASVYRGLYHVLGGTLSALSGVGPEDLNDRAAADAHRARRRDRGDPGTRRHGRWCHHRALADRPAEAAWRQRDARGAGRADRRRAGCAGRWHVGRRFACAKAVLIASFRNFTTTSRSWRLPYHERRLPIYPAFARSWGG